VLEATLREAGLFKKVLDAVKEVVSDANLECSEAGMALQSMDSSHVSLVSFLLRASGFEQYRCDRSLNLGLSIVNLGKILKSCAPEDQLTIRADDNADHLDLTFESKQNRTSEYNLKLMDIDSDSLATPEDLDYDAVVTMSAAEFQRIVKDMTVISDTVEIDVSKEGIRFSAEGDMGSGSVLVPSGQASIDEKDEDLMCSITVKKPVVLAYALKYFVNFVKATPLAKRVTLSLSTEIPLMVEYAVGEVGYVRFFLAPKMDDDE
ncbi:proliferating cell nuclear antigen, N-terminal domain-containing protein, partial [Gorgonomyces haynaldii]